MPTATPRDKARNDQVENERRADADFENGDGVRADRHKCRVPETDETGIPGENVQTRYVTI
jgi:hypothetical protein